MPRSLQGRLLLTFLALNLVSVSGLIVWTAQRVESDSIEQTEHEMEIQAHILNDALREPVENQIQGTVTAGRSTADLVQSYAQSTGNRVTVFDTALKVATSSDRRVPAGYDEAARPELIAASKNDEQHDIRQDEWGHTTWLYVAVPISGAQNEPIGYVQLARPMDPVYADIHGTWLTLDGAGGLLLLLTALASTVLARQIARPVQSLTATTEAIARGRLDERVTPAGPDEIRRLGDAFNQMAARVQDTLARQKEFVANAAHELRSPLTGVRLRLEILLKQSSDYPELARRYLGEMDRDLYSLQGLIEQLLTLSALDENDHAPRTVIDLAPLLYQVADEMAPLAQQAQVRLSTEIPAHLPPVFVNAGQVRIVVRNLLDNAVKYTPAGGSVLCRAEEADGRLCISIEDTGVGIPADALGRIFDRFYRLDHARSQARRGSGLGLALARSLAAANGGEIAVKSEIGAGSVFTVKLPLVAAETGVGGEGEQAAAPAPVDYTPA